MLEVSPPAAYIAGMSTRSFRLLAVMLGAVACNRGSVPPAPTVHNESPSSPAAVTFADIPKFDVHTHLGPDAIGPALAIFEKNGIAGAVNLSGGPYPSVLAQQLGAAKAAGGRILVFANLDFKDVLAPGWVDGQVAWLRQAHQMGARGLKLFKTFGLQIRDPKGARLHVDDPRLDPIFEEVGKLGMPVAIHVGDPKAFFDPITPTNERYEELSLNPGWSFADRSFYPTWEELQSEWERLVARHPHTTFIGVHFGNDPEDPAHVAAMLDRYPNLVVDTAARVGEIGRYPADKLREIFIAHHDRILFGTDMGIGGNHLTLGAPEMYPETPATTARFFDAHWRFFETGETGLDHPSPIQGHWKVNGLGLPREVLEDIYHRNAERLFGLPPMQPIKK
jgi:predicted TIM-barrel fold metal-dependent hydrolase